MNFKIGKDIVEIGLADLTTKENTSVKHVQLVGWLKGCIQQFKQACWKKARLIKPLLLSFAGKEVRILLLKIKDTNSVF